MDIESSQWEAWETQFRALAEEAETVKATHQIKGAKHYLCLYGDNGLPPEEEFEELEKMRRLKDQLKKVEVDADYWQETVLFIP